MEPITGIPEHIRNLSEEDQGPALVKAIHDRKAAGTPPTPGDTPITI